MMRILFIALTLVACKKKAAPEVAVVDEPKPAVEKPVERTDAQAVEQMAANFRRVNFGLDSAELDGATKQALNHNAEIMAKHPNIVVEVQGHADERGTTDYNLALGERRAAKVREYLALMGVPASRLSTRSYGEEVPLSAGANETAWSENRRCEFRITVPVEGVGGTTR
jgi:peptidoglycan-associated lipoprotein